MNELSVIVKRFGEEQNQTDEEINCVLDTLNDNWLTNLSQYFEMSSLQRSKLGLPLLLEQEFENSFYKTSEKQQIFSSSQNIQSETEQKYTRKITTEETTKELKDFCYTYRDIKQKKLILTVGEKVWKFDEELTVKEVLLTLPSPSELILYDNTINDNTKITIAITPPRVIVIQGIPHKIMDNFHFKGVENWLTSLGLRKHVHTFLKHYIDDFLVIPFLRNNDLDYMGILDQDDKRKIMRSVKELQDGDNFEYMSKWLQNLGFGKYSKAFINNYFEICFLNRLKENHLERIGVDIEDRAQIFEIIKQYSEFSSVEATYTWLRDHGFEKDSFQFVRFNIPFYALPMVNFFIINEMGITNYRELLSILRELKDTPAYKVKAMAYWLRDLELERYSLIFAKNLLVDFVESLTILTDAHISRLIEWDDDKEKMKRAVHDMKEFQMYYSATSSLLQEFLIEKYSQLFATNGISIDELPNLTDKKLQEMGITDSVDRARILLGVDKMKEELPISPSTSVSVASYYSLQRPYQSSTR